MDKTPIFYDSIPSTTYEKIGLKRVDLKPSNLQKKRLTLGIGISASDSQLRPMIIFDGKEGSKLRNLNNHKNFLFRKNDSAWMNEILFSEYISKVIVPYVEKTRYALKKPEARSLLVIDIFSDISANLKKKMCGETEFILSLSLQERRV